MALPKPEHVGGQTIVNVCVEMSVVDSDSTESGEHQAADHAEPRTGIEALKIDREAPDVRAILDATRRGVLGYAP